MTRYPIAQARAEYEAIQIDRAIAKWPLNGITRPIVEWVCAHTPIWAAAGPILCLGVRNGHELDLFREVFAPAEVYGVELSAYRRRPDVWVGSFDAMPESWAGRFALLYSNALDHAYEPVATAREWRRVAQPGALLALTLDPDAAPTATDPIAGITCADLMDWFGGTALALEPLSITRPRRVLWRLP